MISSQTVRHVQPFDKSTNPAASFPSFQSNFASRDPIVDRAGINQYNRYFGMCSNDPEGTDIWVEYTDGAGSSGIWLHQRICVDTWTDDCCRRTGQYCVAFWIDGNTSASGNGVVSEDNDAKGSLFCSLSSNCKDDQRYLEILKSREGIRGTYPFYADFLPFGHTCRDYAMNTFWEFYRDRMKPCISNCMRNDFRPRPSKSNPWYKDYYRKCEDKCRKKYGFYHYYQ